MVHKDDRYDTYHLYYSTKDDVVHNSKQLMTQQCVDCHYEGDKSIALSPHNLPELKNVTSDIMYVPTNPSMRIEFANSYLNAPTEQTFDEKELLAFIHQNLTIFTIFVYYFQNFLLH